MEAFLAYMATPVYALFIGLEIYLSKIHRKELYNGKDSANSIFLGIGGAAMDLLMKGFGFTLFSYAVANWSVMNIQNPLFYWILLFFAQDFCFYWLHRVEHQCRIFWAVHVNHHSSEKYNFTVALRSSMLQPLYRYFFFLPCALLGFSAEHTMFMYAINQIYQFFLHTETVGKLGFLEAFMVTPSHHRVHHASNSNYLDRNMGQVLIIWDKMFGTFTKEVELPKYGLTKNLEKSDLLTVTFHEWKDIFADLSKSPDFKTRLKYLFAAPGWSHDGSKKSAKELRKMLGE
jgi:sterol desaturase/sphingolipid hydroxylase (fatty acid hydroxylase superfamily)